MRSRINHLFREIEKDRKSLLDMASQLSPEEFATSYNGKWSASQILTHLLTAEQLSLSYMKKKAIAISNLRDSGVWEDLKILALRISQRIPLKYKVPQVVLNNTPQPMSYKEVEAKWDKLRADVRQFVDCIDEKDLKKNIYRHVIAGRLNVYHALVFFNEHLHHHWPQVERICKRKS